MEEFKPCHRCAIARTFPEYNLFTPACIYCGARLIQRLGQLSRPPSEITARRRAVLADWMAHGHSEQALRQLAKGPMAIGPARPTESARPTHKKSP